METSESGTSVTGHAMVMTTQPVACPAPVLTADFDRCSVPGGVELWKNWGYYSPGVCFIGYVALCTQTSAPLGGFPIAKDETAVRCVPLGYDCNPKTADQRYGISLFNDVTLYAPAFEIRWRSEDIAAGQHPRPHPTPMPTSTSVSATSTPTSEMGSSSTKPPKTPETAGKRNGDMPTGQIAGIVAGAVVAILSALGMALCWLQRRRRDVGMVEKGINSHGNGVGMAADDSPEAHGIAELQSEGLMVKELASNRPRNNDELAPVNREPVELPADCSFAVRSQP